MKQRSRGFTLVEVLASLLILGLIMTTSLAAFYERERRIRHSEEAFLVWQTIANESELIRLQPWHSLSSGESEFRSDLGLLVGLPDLNTTIVVTDQDLHTKYVELSVSWGAGRVASATVVRTDTGGSDLW